MVGFPLLLIPLAVYNIIAFLMPSVSFTDVLFKVPMITGEAWPVTLADVMLALGIVLLLLEVICLLGGLRPGRRVVRVARRPAGNSPRGPGHWIPAKRPSIGWPALLRGSPIALAAAIARLLQHSLTTVATDKPVLKFTVFANEICVAGSCLN